MNQKTIPLDAKGGLYPILPLRGLQAFPNIMLHFDVGREKSLAAINFAMAENQLVFLTAQKDSKVDQPTIDDLYKVGTLAKVKQILKLPGESMRVLVEGVVRAKLIDMTMNSKKQQANIEFIRDENSADEIEQTALIRVARNIYEIYSSRNDRIPADVHDMITETDDVSLLADCMAANLLKEFSEKQEILEMSNVVDRMEKVLKLVSRECDLIELERHIYDKVKTRVEKNQRDYYLREQIKAIQIELGEKEINDISDLTEKAAQLPLNEETSEKVGKELEKLARMSAQSPESNVGRTYIEWILSLPWGKQTTDNLNLENARKVLDKDHYGMDKVKERLIEFLAVRRMKNDMKGTIMCLVGPPGVGKTSIARSVATALGRTFAHVSLGGVHDEAEIRGHRRTYIGAIPGKVMSAIKQAASINPVFLFDEIDKMASDYRGDPASAMLEVLDGEQNFAFRDNYLDIPFDLSKVLFIMTANTLDTIPRPLLDRMEVIQVSGYTDQEKLQIAKRHLLAKQVKEHGITKAAIKINDKTLLDVINNYTREAGVRQLERQIGKVCRKVVCSILTSDVQSATISQKNLHEFLGTPKYLRDTMKSHPEVGIVNGLAWTSVGGETLAVEVAVMPGSGKLDMTGQLGDVMQESARAAISYIRTNAKSYGLDPEFLKNNDIHIHVPEGAVPKDGPSAGVTITCALISALTGRPARMDVAMTGEITLRGRVLPIGGVKEKVLAAHRMGISTVLLPTMNERDLDEIPQTVKEKIDLKLIGSVDDAINVVLIGQGATYANS